jgi:prepilin-type N-terminal cleavage/methylation domain-containing protein
MKKGFTLLEILLVIAAIGILAAIVIVAINPTRQLAQVRNATRVSDTNTLSKSLNQYLIDNGSYPNGITTSYVEICAEGVSDCTGYVDLDSLTPNYLALIPSDPQSSGDGTGYEVAVNPVNNQISIRAINAELSNQISVNQISSGNEFTFSPGTLHAWGVNADGLLGLGITGGVYSSPQEVSIEQWKAVAGLAWYTVAIRNDGTMWTAGFDGNGGALGIGNIGNQNTLVQIGTDNDWAFLMAGGLGASAIKENGELWSWGGNGAYSGDGDTNADPIPEQIGSATNWESGDRSTLLNAAIRTDGTLWMWGEGEYQALGQGSTLDYLAPVQVGSDTDWAEVCVGNFHTLARKDDGTIWNWGDSTSGPVVGGTTGVPVQVGSDNDWQSIGCTFDTGFAIKEDGSMWGWGSNANGAVGNGSGVNESNPVQIGSDTDWVKVDGGYYHAIALKSDNTLWGWGMNISGQLGLGNTTSPITTPSQVTGGAVWNDFGVGAYSTYGLQ